MFFDNVIKFEDALRDNIFPALETFPCPYPQDVCESAETGVIRIVFPEFTCVCPKTGYPDFAKITLCYLPDKLCIELKSWKLYLNSFRMVGAFHEAVSSFLFTELFKLLSPKWLALRAEFFPRGNVDTSIIFEAGKRPAAVDLF